MGRLMGEEFAPEEECEEGVGLGLMKRGLIILTYA